MTPSPTVPGSQARIRRTAALIRGLCVLGAATLLLLPPWFWNDAEWVARAARRQWFDANLSLMQLDAGSRLAGLAASMLQCVAGLWALWEIWRLFGCFAAGEVLAPQPARHVRRLGWSLIALAVTMPLSDTLAVLALTWGNPPGHRQLMLAVSGEHYAALLFGLVLMALGSVLAEAARIAREHSEFV
ncbi:DUF2975 domain-containing protein [Pelomonas sp. KK5]|uniref:DUF2975 domain-containing protein n=1 Tax=Pelomonas sp. KK5 TaxID=1855730 RepID=UPI00097C3ECC|nr:DUF2975 domain-containing protein [Pelomonas sp. KK5]